MLLPITLTIAAAAALIDIWLGLRIAGVRGAARIWIGDGGNPQLTKRMRAQANFVEYTPFFLILLALVEAARGSPAWLWAVAIVYVLARLVHVFGVERGDDNWLRRTGIGGTILGLLVLAGYALVVAYRHIGHADGVTWL